jgi:hypothetical protein
MGSRRWHRAAGWLTLALLLAALHAGCSSLLFLPMYLIKGNSLKADYDGLKDKRVAVVCRPLIELQYSAGTVSNDVAKVLGRLLEQNVKRIKIIDPDRVAEWTDEHNWGEYTEIGQALDADMVVGIDLSQFSIYQGQTLYQGHAKAGIQVFDMRDGGRVVYERTMSPVVFPPNASVPASDMASEEFRRRFVGVLAERIGRYFYEHQANADVGQDSSAF